jgi:hypothetical protein
MRPNRVPPPTAPEKVGLRGVTLGDVFRSKSGRLYEAVALIDQPAVVLRSVDMGTLEVSADVTVVIGSRQFEEYAHLTEVIS